MLFSLTTTQVLADRTTSYTYTAEGLVATIDGPRIDVSDITTYDYDTQGNRILIRNALGQETHTTAHDGAGRPLTVIDPNGLTTQLTYAPRGRLISQSVSDGTDTRVTDYTYDPVGNLTQVTSPDGSVLNYNYDAANRLIGIEDGTGNRIDYTLDAMGNRLETQVTDPNGVLKQHQQQVYNELGRLIQNIDAQNHTTGYAYDANGNLTAATDANLNPTAQAYDALDRLQQTTDALNGTTQYTYDSQDNLTSVTDPNGLTTSYTYDYQGNVIIQTSPDTGTSSYTYDEAGNRLTKTDARGITVSYSYDALNRLTQISYPDSSLDVSYTYDQGTHGIGRLSSMTDAQGTTSYSYNAFGQPLSKTRTSSDNITTAFSYAYDAQGRLTSQTYPSGRILNYGYDTHGQIDSLTLEYPGGGTQALSQNIQRLPFGPIQAFDYGNGLSLSRTFDLDYQLIQQTVTGILQSSYLHDPVGNITDWQDLLDTNRDQQFGYDQLDRLTSASGAFGALGYTYDATGNRLSLSDGTTIETYSYVPNSHRLQQILGSTTDSRSYDAAGNTLQSLIGSYSYDDSNRLVSFSKSGTQADYAYNGEGERIQKTVNGTTTRYRYGNNAQLLGEYDANGEAIREYAYLAGQPIAQLSKDPATQAETIHYVHTDHLGAVVKATDSAQTLVWDAQRKPFGERNVTTAQITMPLGFPGQVFDEETGTYYNYFRDYDPTTGRYLQSDPIGLEGGLNTYSYVKGNPIQLVDPLGLAYSPGGEHGLPGTDSCKPSEWSECQGRCPHGVNGCYVTIKWRIKGVRNGQPIRVEERTVNCNCKESDCPPESNSPFPPWYLVPLLPFIPIFSS
ncbi:MAG: RHS repeat protein [Candidatus Thiodiazotropha sp. (ex Monitilora ramsayi)]|nr:RHS repeat protein [Candidatus Thiodiazotropha sp. (ex Monitilora ramsayi)]